MSWRRVAAALLFGAAGAWHACLAGEPRAQRGGTYVEPPPVDAVYLPAGPDERWEKSPLAAFRPLSLRLALDFPLRATETPGTGRRLQGSPPASPTLQAAVRYVPLGDSYWFAQATFMRYLRAGRQQPWNPDFTYVFGYEDWHPGTYTLTYSNYSGTRFDPRSPREQGRWNFPFGTWSAGYKDALPGWLEPVFLVGDGDQALCSANLNYTRRYTQPTGETGQGKQSVSAGCRYSRPNGLFAQLTLFAYPRGGQQQPWDPDYTYSFGLFDWRPGTFSIHYSNYSGNRLPGRRRGTDEGAVRSGSITLSWSAQW